MTKSLRLASSFAITTIALMGVGCMWHWGLAANLMLLIVERPDAGIPESEKAQAIVVLGGRVDRAPKAAELYLSTGLPLYAAGEDVTETLRRAYSIEPRWIDFASRDTESNAAIAACRLFKSGVTTVSLVTDRWHMLRARLWFTHYGFKVVPAESHLVDMPEIRSWWETPMDENLITVRKARALHEWGGLAEFWLSHVLKERAQCPPAVRSVATAESPLRHSDTLI